MHSEKKAWEYTRELTESEMPFAERADSVDWNAAKAAGRADLERMRWLWDSTVGDALMPFKAIAMYVQEQENLGYDVSAAEALLPAGFAALSAKNDIELYRLTCRILRELWAAPKDPSHPRFKYRDYDSFSQYAAAVTFPEYPKLKLSRAELYDRVWAGWMAQTCAGAVGTAIEGYHTLNLEKAFGRIDGYIKTPEMYNDDITFELVFLEVFAKRGNELSSAELAEMWAARIPLGYTAEAVALDNIKNGIYPPESGIYHNPFCEMIGAQMRGGVCGMVAPGNPRLAAQLAWTDSEVSHHSNGSLGEVFNAIMVSLAFVESDVKKICRMAIDMMPADSLYRAVVEYAWSACEKYGNWRDAWLNCDEKYKRYSWEHAFPNAAAEVVSLYFCGGDFDTLVSTVAMCGQDVDCNAAQVANIPAVIGGSAVLSHRWTAPFGDRMLTYVRGLDTLRFEELADNTVNALLRAGNAEAAE